ncbi:MFS domain-containing protein [Mycena sanguinolenta]|uniref:MFS domain-containing protein n=1 Tax=Mycena sanguinolenta TaxID=230812 RepID=A0A8H7CWR6_9AGAR|nr:MFS domain-containing protein [Mycena sanguinolenta]
MVGEPVLMIEPVENDLSLANSVTEDSTLEKTEKQNDISQAEAPLDIWSQEYPDGGARTWLVVFGGTCITFSTFGYVNSWGVFQSYYTQNILKNSSPSNIAWIGSIQVSCFAVFWTMELIFVQYSLIFIPGLVSGHYFDRGYLRVPFLTASAVLIAATFLVGQCTEYWHFLLCQGFVTGISAGIVYGPTMAVIGHWFQKKRGIATGILATGSSVGGTLFPIVARNLIPRVGFPWTLRIIGFILICTLGCANLTVRRRLPPKHVPGGLFNPAAFKNAAYTIYCITGIVAFLGLYTVLTYIGVSATAAGLSSEFSFYLISIANAASLFGRITAGLITDKFGAVNVIVPFSAVAAIMTYVWPLARSNGAFVAVAIIYGFSSGAYVSSFLLPMFHLGDIADVGRRSGMAMTLTAIGALAGPPISGAIYSASGGYSAVGYYAGSMIFAAIALMLVTRHLVLRKVWGKF